MVIKRYNETENIILNCCWISKKWVYKVWQIYYLRVFSVINIYTTLFITSTSIKSPHCISDIWMVLSSCNISHSKDNLTSSYSRPFGQHFLSHEELTLRLSKNMLITFWTVNDCNTDNSVISPHAVLNRMLILS